MLFMPHEGLCVRWFPNNASQKLMKTQTPTGKGHEMISCQQWEHALSGDLKWGKNNALRSTHAKARLSSKALCDSWLTNMTGSCSRSRVTNPEAGVSNPAPQWRYKHVSLESKCVPGNPRVRFQRRSRVRCKIIANRTWRGTVEW